MHLSLCFTHLPDDAGERCVACRECRDLIRLSCGLMRVLVFHGAHLLSQLVPDLTHLRGDVALDSVSLRSRLGLILGQLSLDFCRGGRARVVHVRL